MRLIDADALARRMEPGFLIEALRAGHRGGMGKVERVLIEQDGGNAALTWVGWQEERGIAVKTATGFPQNSRLGDRPNVQSLVILFDAQNGAPLAALHGESFTRMKTAADSALAADILAVLDAGVLAVLGAGGQAETHVRFHHAVRPTIKKVLIWNRSIEPAKTLAARLANLGVAIEVAASAEAAVREASVIACLTGATAPILRGDWLRAGAHVDLVGGYTPTMRESDDAVVRRGRLFADSRRFGVMQCGDFCIPITEGVIQAEAVEGDLFDLCSGRVVGRRTPNEITVFKNGGGGHLDLMAARALYDFSG